MSIQEKIKSLIKEDVLVKESLSNSQLEAIEALSNAIIAAVKSGNKILVFGNGGSASDSLHITAELVGRFRKERAALPCIALTSNVSTLTALGNDYSFDSIFERQIEALGKKEDLAIGISTSGKSKNVIRAMQKAKSLDLKTAVLTGEYKGELSRMADISINVPSNNTPRIQEAHITIAHIVCEIVEDAL